MWRNPDEIAGDGIDNDANGYVDDWRGWDFFNDDNNPQDDEGHGTHVAGTIGAQGNNGAGVTGVNWNVTLMALKFLDANGSGTTEAAVRAVLYASAEGADITNNSWGGGEFSQALYDAIAEADRRGSLFLAAAGNSTADNDSGSHYPSNYELPNVVAVAATNELDELAYFSNIGRHTVNLAAPGTNIYSTVLGGLYEHYSGTSMATPHVAGTAALALAAFPDATHVGLKSLLLRTVDPKPALTSRTTTGGRLNANTAVRCSASPKVWLESPRAGFKATVGAPVAITVLASTCGLPAGVSVGAPAGPVAAIASGPIAVGVYVPR